MNSIWFIGECAFLWWYPIECGINGNRFESMGQCVGLDGFPFWLQASSSETTTNKESVIVSHVIPVYTLRKKRETKTVSVKTVSVL